MNITWRLPFCTRTNMMIKWWAFSSTVFQVCRVFLMEVGLVQWDFCQNLSWSSRLWDRQLLDWWLVSPRSFVSKATFLLCTQPRFTLAVQLDYSFYHRQDSVGWKDRSVERHLDTPSGSISMFLVHVNANNEIATSWGNDQFPIHYRTSTDSTWTRITLKRRWTIRLRKFQTEHPSSKFSKT